MKFSRAAAVVGAALFCTQGALADAPPVEVDTKVLILTVIQNSTI